MSGGRGSLEVPARRGWQPDTRPGRRLFVAVPLPEATRDAVTGLVERVRDDPDAAPAGSRQGGAGERSRRAERQARTVRWVRLDGLHVTLRFLGPTLDDRLPALEAALAETVAGADAFQVVLTGAGGFPSDQRPRALWLGIGEGSAPLAALAARLERALESRGWPGDERSFRAHLTLARSDGVPDAAAAVERLKRAAAGLDAAWTADRVVLFESITGGGPARYVPLREARLGT